VIPSQPDAVDHRIESDGCDLARRFGELVVATSEGCKEATEGKEDKEGKEGRAQLATTFSRLAVVLPELAAALPELAAALQFSP
jgi:hypothetical protein